RETSSPMNALPSPKPNRRKRLALRFAALVAAISVLGAAYWFTRPPELVWYTSPPLGEAGYRLKVRVPFGWKVYPSSTTIRTIGAQEQAGCTLIPADTLPRFLHRFIPNAEDYGNVRIGIHSGPGLKD